MWTRQGRWQVSTVALVPQVERRRSSDAISARARDRSMVAAGATDHFGSVRCGGADQQRSKRPTRPAHVVFWSETDDSVRPRRLGGRERLRLRDQRLVETGLSGDGGREPAARTVK